MKRIIMFVLLFAALKVAGQTTGYLRFDTVKIMKQNGTCELYLINKTKDSLGLLTNVGGGLTRFIKSKAINDSSIVVGLDTLVIRGASGGAPTPSWQQTLNVSPNTYGRLVFDTSFTKPTGVGDPAEHTWFTMNPLVKEDSAYTSPFYMTQYGGLNNGRTNEVVMLGWNISPGGGHRQPNKPALAFSLEGNYFTDRGNGLKRFMESHLYYVDSNGLQYRPWSYEINTTDGVNNFYHSVSSFSLRGFGSVSSPANNPYYTIQGTANLTESSFINISNQTEYFGTSANFNQDANTANYTINSGSGKPINIFNVSNFNEASVPNVSIYGLGYDGSQIVFNGTTTGQLGRILFDSSQSRIGSFTNVPMRFLPNQTDVLELRSTRANIYQPTIIGAGLGVPIAQLDVRSATQDQTMYIENGKAGGYAGIFSTTNAAGGNIGLDVTATGTLPNKGVNFNPTMSATDFNIHSAGPSKAHIAGKVGIGSGVTSPDSTLQINGSFHNNAGVRMEGLPIGPGTKAVRIDANGTLSVADTTIGGGSSHTFSNGLTEDGGTVKLGGVLTESTHISGGASAYSLQLDSMTSITLFSGLEYVSSGIGSNIQMSDSVMTIGATSTTDFTSFTFSPTRIKFTAADGAGSAGDVWTNTGSGYGHWAAPSGSWSPTLTADANVDGTPTALHATYARMGNIVTCYVTVSVDPTANTTQTEVGIPLPVASNFANANDVSGSGAGSIGNGQATFVQVSANTTSDRATLIFQSGSTSASIVTLSFQYTIL